MLYALGLPVSTVLEGRIAKTAFDPTYLAQHPPLYSSEPGPDARVRPAVWSSSPQKMPNESKSDWPRSDI